MDYYIFRHGETYESLNNIDYSQKTVISAKLLPEAREALEKLAKHLRTIQTDYNVSSPFLRCIKTLEVVNPISGKVFEIDDRLGEWVKQKGETFGSLRNRVKGFLEDLDKKNYKSVCVCTHGAVIAGIVSFITTGQYNILQLPNYPKPGILVKIIDGKVEYINFRGD